MSLAPPARHLRLALAHDRAHPVDDVVLITLAGDVRVADAYAEWLPAARIHLISLHPLRRRTPAPVSRQVTVTHCEDLQQIVDHLTGVAPPQLIVDLAANPKRQQKRFTGLFYLLDDTPGRRSLYLVREPAGQLPGSGLAAAIDQLESGVGPTLTRFRPWDDRLSGAIGRIRQRGQIVMIAKRGRHALKLRDERTTTALHVRRGDSWGQQIAAREPVRFTSRASLWTNIPAQRFHTAMTIPELFLREYRDVVCAPRGLAVASGAMLPVSFHRLHTPVLNSYAPTALNVSRWSVALDPELADAPVLDGAYFHLDSPYPWGFGHFMGEDMSKLWAWEQAKARHPDLKVLLSSASPPSDPLPTGQPKAHQLALLAAMGIGADDVVCLDGPARVELLLGASPMFDNPHFAHPDLTRMWDARREALRSPVGERPTTPKRVFASRGTDLRRHCRNALEVEQLFDSHGYQVIRPDLLDTRTQVDIFAGAEAVAGFGGSAMFNMMHTPGPARWIVIASRSYHARNEFLIAAARGGDYHHFLCEPIEPPPAADGNQNPFHWDYEFDFGRDGAALEALLRR